jgi:hypothetical protein
MTDKTPTPWNGATVRQWLQGRVVAARGDQVVAERAGRRQQDDGDKANAEEMVCTLLLAKAADDQQAFAAQIRALLDRDEYIWRGVYDDTRFDRHVRTCLRKLAKMTKTNDGFEKTAHYQ